jgi:hypothetical protein
VKKVASESCSDPETTAHDVENLAVTFVSLNSLPLLRIANKENSATPSAEDRCMVEGRALTTPALQDAPSPFCRLAGPLGEFRGALKKRI